MKFASRLLFSTAFVASLTAMSFGAGFSLYETSARGVAMGGATLGHYHDASAVFANPALITDAKSKDLLFGLSLINPGMKLELQTQSGQREFSPKDQWFPPPFVFYTQGISDSLFFGIGLYTPYGLGILHSPDWAGRFSSVETKISTFNLNPNLAWKVNDRLSLAIGIDAQYFDITLTRNIPKLDMLLHNEADSIGFGGNAALAYKLTDTLGLGLTYRSEIIQELEGDASISGMPGSYDIWEDFTLPQSVSLGLNYTGIDRWDIGAIAMWTGWYSYDNLTIHFKQPLLGLVNEYGSEKNWSESWRFGIGAEFTLSEFSSIAFGYVYDQDPIDLGKADYLLPPGDRNIFSIGLTTKLTERWKAGITYARIELREKSISARPEDGIYDTHFVSGKSNVISFDLSTSF